MKAVSTKLTLLIILLLTVASVSSVYSQSLSISSDIVSRYIWRGSDLGANTPSIQPDIEYSVSGFTAGLWGAWSTANPRGLDEIDIYANYSFSLSKAGGLNLGITDYTNPNSGTKIGNFNNYNSSSGPGAHSLEANFNYSGPENFPLSLSFNVFFYNVANNPIYFEAGYSTKIQDTGLDFFIGGTPGESGGYYGVKKFAVINTGIKVNEDIKITNSFSLPIFGSVIVNPATEDTFYVLGISI